MIYDTKYTNESDNLTKYRDHLIELNDLDLQLYSNIYSYQLYWHRMLLLQHDSNGTAKRVCSDVANIMLTSPIKITTPDAQVNNLIKSELFERIDLQSILARNLQYILGIGNGALVTYISAIDGLPTIDLISGLNCVPKKFNKSKVYSMDWLSSFLMDGKEYILRVSEDVKQRSMEILNSNQEVTWNIYNNFGLPLQFTSIANNATPVEDYIEGGHTKFAWITTNILNARWVDTPFNNGFCWPTVWYERIATDIENIDKEFSWETSGRMIFASPDVLMNRNITNFTNNVSATYGVYNFLLGENNNQFTRKDDLFCELEVGEDKVREFNPSLVNGGPRIQKLEWDYKMLGLVLGLGHDFYNLEKMMIESTATQVLLEHQPAYRTIQSLKTLIANAIKTIVLGISDYWYQLKMITKDQWKSLAGNIGVEFDDGVFVSKQVKLQDAINLHSAGVLSTKTTLERGYNMSPEDAQNEIQLRRQEMVEDLLFQQKYFPQEPSKNNKEK